LGKWGYDSDKIANYVGIDTQTNGGAFSGSESEKSESAFSKGSG
jgi:hypothetical protein